MKDQELHAALVAIMLEAGLPEDSSDELALYVSWHYPDHGVALVEAATAGLPLEPEVEPGSPPEPDPELEPTPAPQPPEPEADPDPEAT